MRVLHPHAVTTVRFEGKPLDDKTVFGVRTYMNLYLIIFVLSTMVVAINQFDLVTTFTAVASCLNNIGPGLELVGPMVSFADFSPLIKLVLSFDMLVGRLEIFPMLVLFAPSTWLRNKGHLHPLLHMFGTKQCGRGRLCMRRETNNDRQQRLFVTGLLISAVVGALIGLLWPLWFPADSACETTIPDASFSVPTLAMGGTQLPGEEGAAMKICCLTFDDGPSKYTPQVLAALEKCDAKATFFVTAQDANQDYLSYLTDIEAAGHQIALHSASHSYSRIYSSTENFWLDIKALRATLANYIDVDAIHWLRFPGGSTNTVSHRYGGRQIMQQLKAQAEQKGYAWIDWNVCAEDATASHPNAAQILRNVQNDAKDQPICVVLMHDTNATHETVKALPDILEWFAAKGYRFFTVQQMAE